MTNAPTKNLTRADGSPLYAMAANDEQIPADLLAFALRYEGQGVTTAGTGIATVRSAQEIDPDVIVLDIMLSDSDSLKAMRWARGHYPSVSILFLAAKDAVGSRVAKLTAGGDDYVTKPFSLEGIVVRLRALLHRSGTSEERPASILEAGDLCMDEDPHEVWRGGDKTQLTATEFKLLRYLMCNPHRALPKPQVLDRVWSYSFGGQANIVGLYISCLCRKIDRGCEPIIHTMCGVEYVLKPVAGADERG